jgi:hypothetical protein
LFFSPASETANRLARAALLVTTSLATHRLFSAVTSAVRLERARRETADNNPRRLPFAFRRVVVAWEEQ